VPALIEALELQRAVGRRHGEGVALCNLGEANLELGRYDEAVSYLQQALPVARETGSSRLEGYILQHLGRARLDQGQVGLGADLLELARAIHSADGDKYGQARDLDLLGLARSRAGQREGARQAWQGALRLFEGLGEDQQVARLLSQLVELAAPDDDS
jgi:tetratricopeptide (TPR) repeat protein